MDEVGITGDQHVSADIGVCMGDFDTVGGHLDVDAVLDAPGPHPISVGGAWGWSPGGHEHRLDAGGIERRWVVDELAGAPEFRSLGDPVRVGFGDDYASMVGDFLF